MLGRVALGGIWAYQRYLSPRKGYACAHRVAHGGTGCSGYAKQLIRDRGLIAALPGIRARFAACKRTAQQMHADREEQQDKDRRRKRRREHWFDTCATGFCGASLVPCGSSANTSPTETGSSTCTHCSNPLDGCDGCSACDTCSCSP
ncbi:MAG: membrane protein insertion efficiency factor YidD [Pseudomonadota bacterium]